eukprot:SAG11_NODE_6059_length_1397_cov_1.097843_1_plen_183_part_00
MDEQLPLIARAVNRDRRDSDMPPPLSATRSAHRPIVTPDRTVAGDTEEMHLHPAVSRAGTPLRQPRPGTPPPRHVAEASPPRRGPGKSEPKKVLTVQVNEASEPEPETERKPRSSTVKMEGMLENIFAESDKHVHAVCCVTGQILIVGGLHKAGSTRQAPMWYHIPTQRYDICSDIWRQQDC